jgi:SAM-dependent methyltransferase
MNESTTHSSVARTDYSEEFFSAHQDGACKSARVILPMVLERLPCASAVDVGCGLGTWLAVFRELGVQDVIGIDGDYVDRDRLEIPRDRFLPFDLEQPLSLPRRFDLVVSLEVAEHLPPSAAATFVASLCSLGPVVLFSAAAPFQGGTNHVNEQWPDYWARLFSRHGFVPIDFLRRRIWSHEEVEWWYAQNVLVYADEAQLDRMPLLQREYRPWEGRSLSIVHPKRYLEWVEWGLSRDACR